MAKNIRDELRAYGDTCSIILVDKGESTLKRAAKYTNRIWNEMWDMPMVKIIYSVPGAGKLTACYLTSLIIDIDRYATSKKFVASFGLVPKVQESGDSSPECGITRRGDPVARRLIYQMTVVHIRHEKEGQIAAKYERLRKSGKPYREAIVACCNSLLKILYVMLTENREFVSDPKSLEESRIDAESTLDSEEEVSLDH